jgi:hypothetical protein
MLIDRFRHPFSAAAWAALLPFAAWAAPTPQAPSPQALQSLPAAVQQALVLKRVALQQQAAARAGLDTQAPAMSRFSVADRAQAGGEAAARIAVTDDLSGFASFFAHAVEPHGGELRLFHAPSLPRARLHEQLELQIDRYARPGLYTFDFAYVSDAAGNYTYYDAAALAALGNNVVRVHNQTGYDLTPPSLIKGHLLTSQLSLSASHPGTSMPAYAGAQVQLSDVGGSVVAGLRWAVLSFCLADESSCFYLAEWREVQGLARDSLHAGGQPVYYTTTPGRYRLRDVQVGDQAGNFQQYTSTAFGGDTDLSRFFPSEVITLTP